MIVLLARLAFSNVVSLNASNYKKFFGGKDPLFVKFYSQFCTECSEMAEDFLEASKAMDTVRFAEVNCPENEAICKEFNVKKYPEIRLYFSDSKKSIEYHGKKVYEDFLDFIEQKTDLVTNRPTSGELQQSSEEIERKIFSSECSMTFFYTTWSTESRETKPIFEQSRKVFKNDDFISFTSINCEVHKTLCIKHNVASYPTIKLYKPLNRSTRVYKYENRDLKGIIHFVNTFCSANRLNSGLLNEKAGIISGTDEVISKFMREKDDKSSIIPDMENIPGTETYVTYMKRIIRNGKKVVNEDIKTLDHIIDHFSVSGKGLDFIKIKRNILNQFISVSEEPFNEEIETEYKEIDETQQDEPLNIEDFNVTINLSEANENKEENSEFDFPDHNDDITRNRRRAHSENDLLFYSAHEL